MTERAMSLIKLPVGPKRPVNHAVRYVVSVSHHHLLQTTVGYDRYTPFHHFKTRVYNRLLQLLRRSKRRRYIKIKRHRYQNKSDRQSNNSVNMTASLATSHKEIFFISSNITKEYKITYLTRPNRVSTDC
jgi:hypothetical protein